MKDNGFIDSVRQQIKTEAELAWEQSQNGGSTEAKEEGRTAYKYLCSLLFEMERDAVHDYMVSSQDLVEDEDDNDEI